MAHQGPRPIRIAGTGSYLPPTVVSAEEIDRLTGAPQGWTASKTGVLTRHMAVDETASQMAAKAVRQAAHAAGIDVADLDAIVCTSATPQQLIPCTAALVLEALDLNEGTTAFDVNATCLSFVVGLDMMAWPVAAGRYERVALVASEITTVGIDYDHRESAGLFGDAAAAVILERTPDGESSALLAADQRMYPEGTELCQIPGGGTAMHPNNPAATPRDFLFQMHGPALFMMAADIMPDFIEGLFEHQDFELADIDLLIPHQASLPAMTLMRKRLELPPERFLITADTVGNAVAASIPLGLDLAVQRGVLQRGMLALLTGTSAGFGVGGALLRF